MAHIGFVGIGRMGAPMVRNLVKAGNQVTAFDIDPSALRGVVQSGAKPASSLAGAVAGVEVFITMLPAGAHVRTVYLGADGILNLAAQGTQLIDCSTIDVVTAREVADAAKAHGFDMLDAPVSGGVAGAEGAALTFMVGGDEKAFDRARPVFAAMGKTVVHAGPPGNGQAAKICNNLILGISMIAVSEAFVLAERLGLDPDKLFQIASNASGQCWSLTSYCPVPGLVPSSPANRHFQPGFSVALMLKDLKLAQSAAAQAGTPTPLGAEAVALYERFSAMGRAGLDFSAIIQLIRDGANRGSAPSI